MSRSNFNQVSDGRENVHFGRALFGEVESSRMVATPVHLSTFNAGDIVPIYCREILPKESISMDLESVIRQTTLLTPTMGNMFVDFYAFFVPNRIVNSSWKAVEGENYSGSWTANSVSLAPLTVSSIGGGVQIPVGSVADYYGFPTQAPIPYSVLNLCHDLKFRGYVMIYNEWFRDQNYQPPIPITYLNVYQGFLDDDSSIALDGVGEVTIGPSTVGDGSFGAGAIVNSLYGNSAPNAEYDIAERFSVNSFRATEPPLKANKFHDYFTSTLPSPQKSSSSVFAPVTGTIGSVPVVTSSNPVLSGPHSPLLFKLSASGASNPSASYLTLSAGGNNDALSYTDTISGASAGNVYPSNLQTQAGAEVTGLALSVDDIRMASAIQQVYETMARGGSRYRELVNSFFGLEVDDPYSDIPRLLGHIRRDLDLYQTAQTSASEAGSTAQGNLAAFGYTSTGGHLFSAEFIEHGYLHIFAVVRHKNIYTSYLSRDNFRLNMLDFYTPPLANISEQPVYVREINPFASDPNAAFGYQEAWAEYRFEPDLVSGYMRSGIADSLSLWNYSDDFDSGLSINNATWLKSNSESVLNRTLAVSSSLSPQFKGQFKFIVDKVLPMPTYSVPGMDII